jgi:hypothetical protein
MTGVFKFLVFSLLFSFLINSAFTQKHDIDFEFKSKYGFLIAHRSVMSHIPKEHCKSIEYSVVFQTNGQKSWHRSLNYPKMGFSSLISSAGNKDLLGNLFGAYSFLQFSFFKIEKNRLFVKLGTGLAYAQKVYNQETNPKNNALSSHLNALINFGLFYQYNFERTYLNFGLDLTHLSNGASKMPNLGINLSYLSFAIGYNIKKSISKNDTTTLKRIDKSWNYLAIGIGSFKESYPTGERKFPVFALSFLGNKIYSHKLGYELGLDLIYKPSIDSYKPVIYKTNETMIQLGFYNGYIMTLHKLQILIGMGIYIKDEYNADDYFYHRFGFRYNFNKKLFANLTLKSHWARADYIEYGIGIKL